ncbi:MAG: polysaccharide biosynthesis C-terminal domain-containing protein [Planctomycetes bacterium]|nr:polysaccharide biosynthesis C-terminal domain-containing protein [Planctomycetota bacterium]
MNFRRWVVFTFLVHVFVIAVDKGGGLILYLLTAEHADQHGEASILASLPFIVGALANLGLATAMVYFVRRGRYAAQQCFETALSVAVVWGGLVATMAALVTLFVLPALRPDWQVDPWLVLPWCAVVPLLLVASYANSTQLATERVRDYGVVHMVTSLAFLPAFFLCFLWQGGDVAKGHVPYAVTWGRLLSTAMVAALALWMVRKVVTLRFGLHRGFLSEGIRYGWKANLTSTLTYLNHRIDLLVLAQLYVAPQGLIGDEAREAVKSQVAFYSMAVTWAELVWHFPEAMRDLFFSKVAGSSHEKAREMTPILARLGLALSVLGGVTLLFVIDPVMGAITAVAKGSDAVWLRDWSPTVCGALLMLTPGTMAYTVSKVLQADLAARNQLQVCVNAQLLVLVTMIGLDCLWIPGQGAVGAAAASTVAYVASTFYVLIAYARQTGTPWWRCLIAQPADFVYIREIVQAVWSKLRRRRT